jgi:hypothetical protein
MKKTRRGLFKMLGGAVIAAAFPSVRHFTFYDVQASHVAVTDLVELDPWVSLQIERLDEFVISRISLDIDR